MPTAPHVPGSRDRMLETTIDLLRGWGLAGAGINDIVRESGAPKGSVYHHFPGGKLQLASEALVLYAGRVRVFIGEALASRSARCRQARRQELTGPDAARGRPAAGSFRPADVWRDSINCPPRSMLVLPRN